MLVTSLSIQGGNYGNFPRCVFSFFHGGTHSMVGPVMCEGSPIRIDAWKLSGWVVHVCSCRGMCLSQLAACFVFVLL